MTKGDIDKHIDAMLDLLIVDNACAGNPRPISKSEIAKATGMTNKEVGIIEIEILKKLKRCPAAWEAATLLLRNAHNVE